MFFFFQAEDGIRDVAVTGVQTCALPICRFARASASSRAYRYVPGCLATQRPPDVREAKKKTKLQNVAITLAADVSKSRASGNRNETTAFCGSADSISSGVRTS